MRSPVLCRPAIALAVLSAAAAAGACASAPNDSRPAGASVVVAVSPVEVTAWPNRFEAGGTLAARNSAVISSRTVAPIRAVFVRPGDAVRSGQPLVELDAAEFRAYAAQAAANVDAAREAATAAGADARSAAAALNLAQAAHRRVSTLHAQRSATPQELDQAVADLDMAEARSAAAQARIGAAASALEAARAAARVADIAAAYGVLTAPFDGTVVERTADPGTMATPGVPLLVIEDRSALQLEVHLDASRTALAHVNETVQVRIDTTGRDDAAWSEGRIVEIARIDPAAHSFAVKIALAPAPSWRSGLFGRASFPGDARQTLTVPATAIVRRGQLAFVFVASKDGVARLRAVSVGAVEDTRAEVLDGVTAGESVLTAPASSLDDGARITTVPAPASPPERRR